MPELNTRVKELRRLAQELERAVENHFYGARTRNQLLALETEMACVGVLMRDEIEKQLIERAQSDLDPNFHPRSSYTSPSKSQ